MDNTPEYYKQIFLSSPQGIILHGPDGRIIVANEAARRILGPKIMEEGRELLAEDGTPMDPKDHPVRRVLRTGVALSRFVMGVRSPGQERFLWIAADTVPILGEDGQAAYVFSIVQDISAEREREEQIRLREEHYRLIAEHSSDVIWVLNLTLNTFTYISPSILQLRGLTVEQALAERLEDSLDAESLVIVQTEVRRGLPEFLAAPEKADFHINQLRQPCADGTLIWVEVSTRYRMNSKGEIEVLGISRNIDQRKRAEEELRRAYEEKAMLLSELQHRVKNSFALISSMIQLAAGSAKSAEAASALTEMLMRVNAVSELYSILYSANNFTELDTEPYCQRLIDTLIGISPTVRAELDIENISLPIRSAGPLGLILTELVTNALKYAYGPAEEGSLHIRLRSEGESIRLLVSDSGKGLPPDFDPAQSTGLGLALVQTLSAQLDGCFTIRSEGGTHCELVFPA